MRIPKPCVTNAPHAKVCESLESKLGEIAAFPKKHIQPKAKLISAFVEEKLKLFSDCINYHFKILRHDLVQLKGAASAQVYAAARAFSSFAATVKSKIIDLHSIALSKASEVVARVEDHFGMSLHEMAINALDVTKKVAKIAIATILFLSNSSVFVIGAITGIAAPDTMSTIINRISRIWSGPSQEEIQERQEMGLPPIEWNGLSPIQRGAIIIAGLIAWPITLVSASFLTGAAVSLELKRVAEGPLPAPQVVNQQRVVE